MVAGKLLQCTKTLPTTMKVENLFFKATINMRHAIALGQLLVHATLPTMHN